MIPASDTHTFAQHAPVSTQHQRHASSAGYLAPITPIGTLDTWNAATGNMHMSPSPLSPSSMGSLVNRAKTILRGKRNSYQVSSTPNVASGKPDVYRAQTYQQPIPKPVPRRQATAPLLSQQATKSGPSRATLKKSGGPIQISQPVLITSTMALGDNLTSRDSWRPRSVCISTDSSTFGKRPTPPSPSKSDVQGVRIRHTSLPRPQSCASFSGYAHPPSETLRAIHEAGMLVNSQSGRIPRAMSISTTLSRDDVGLNVDLKAGARAKFGGYDSTGSLDTRSPLECDSPFPSRKPSADCTGSGILPGDGLEVPDTMLTINDAGMLHDSGASGLEGETTMSFDETLKRMFSDHIDDLDCETDSASGSVTSPPGLAYISLDATSYLAGYAKDRGTRDQPDSSHDIVDEYLGFGEDTLLFSIRTRGQEGPPSIEGGMPVSHTECGTLARTQLFPHRPMAMLQCLEHMDPPNPETLLTPWRSQLGSLSEFGLKQLDVRRKVEVIANEVVMPAQGAEIETFVPSLPIPTITEPLRIDKASSRSNTPVGASMPPEIPSRSPRRPSPSPVLRSVSLPSSSSIPAELWESYSGPSSPTTLTHSIGSHALASTSRAPVAPSRDAAPTAARKHRNTRELFIESQVSHIVRGTRGVAAVGARTHRRKHSRIGATEKGKKAEKLEAVDVKEDEENSSEWIVVSHLLSHPSGALPKSHARRALYASPSKADQLAARAVPSSQRAGMKKSPSARGMVKSPSVRSGLSKSGSRQGLRASQSRSTLHASQSRNGILARAHGSPPRSRLPASSSGRSLPDSSKAATRGTPGSPQRPQRSRARPRAERRRPGFWDMGQKENLPASADGDEDWVSGVDTPIRSGSATPLKANFERSGLSSPGPFCVETPHDGWAVRSCGPSGRPPLSVPLSPRKRSQDDADPTRASAKTFFSEVINSNLAARRLGTPSVPPKNPARATAGLRSRNRF
ncbi:hypothetical protein BDV93DRAFT_602772 [Ceratobasidium sp. AG-I]|nr:hypothetical protein BDV93DRAFT_602772 [Ceratobasidium sp. AG-I]